jgi:uncharacterized protein (TIGR00369 family)
MTDLSCDTNRSAVVRWADPGVIYAAHAHMTSLELFRAMMAGSMPLEPSMALFGADIASVEPGEVVLGLDLGERHLDHSGHVQSGIIAALTDTAAGYAVHTRLAAGMRCASVEFHVSMIAPVPLAAGRLLFTGRAAHVGLRIATCDATVTAGNGTLHARMGMTMIVLPRAKP